MAFVITPKTEGFYYGISLPTVTDTGASHIIKFEMRFKRVSRSKLNALQKAQEEMTDSDIQVDSLERDTDYVLEIAEGWKYVQGADGEDLPFDREHVRLMLDNYPNAAATIVGAFFEATLGGGAKRKN